LFHIFLLNFYFKLDDASIFRHKEDRKVKSSEEEQATEMYNMNVEFEDVNIEDDEEIKDDKLEKSKEDSEEEEKSLFPDTSFQMKLAATNIE
jgi:hypothetical protein